MNEDGVRIVRAVRARLEWGAAVAADLEACQMRTQRGSPWTVTATIVQSNVFRLSQRPLTFVLPLKSHDIVWPVETLTVAGASLTATLGPRKG